MTSKEFTQRLKSILPEGDTEIALWVAWAKDMEEIASDNYERPKGSYKTQEVFLQEMCGSFEQIRETHGREVAGKVISMAQIHFCLFPWELKQAAVHLAGGCDHHEIQRLSEEGLLEDCSGPEEEPNLALQ